MNKISVKQSLRDLADAYLWSAMHALSRAKYADSSLLEGKAACIEAIISSFLCVEAFINRIFYKRYNKNTASSVERFLNKRWKGRIPVTEKIRLMLTVYANTELPPNSDLIERFKEFAILRNSIVHTKPEEWEVLIEHKSEKEWTVHDEAPLRVPNSKYPRTKFTERINKISLSDAEKALEIALQTIDYLDSKFNMDARFIHKETKKDTDVTKKIDSETLQIETTTEITGLAIRPCELLKKLDKRYFEK